MPTSIEVILKLPEEFNAITSLIKTIFERKFNFFSKAYLFKTFFNLHITLKHPKINFFEHLSPTIIVNFKNLQKAYFD